MIPVHHLYGIKGRIDIFLQRRELSSYISIINDKKFSLVKCKINTGSQPKYGW